jgi:uncharacterized membrane protein YuzA (DUF378 family)
MYEMGFWMMAALGGWLVLGCLVLDWLVLGWLEFWMVAALFGGSETRWHGVYA